MKNRTQKILNIILPIITVGAIILVWVIASFAVDSSMILPTVGETFSALFATLGKGSFYLAFLFTIIRSLIAFIVSFTLAFLMAYLSKKFFTARKIIAPVIMIIRALPTIAVVLLLLLWTNSQIAPCVVTMLVVLPTIFVNAQNSFDSVDDEIIKALRFHKVSEKTILFKVQLPIMAPSLIRAVGAGLSLNIKLMVAAEVLSATANSIGYLLNHNYVYFETATMMALVLMMVIVCVVIEVTTALIAKKVGKWQ